MAMIVLLATVMIVTMISISLVELMSTDITHASIQYAVLRSFYIAQAGLEQGKGQVVGAADPAAYTTPDAGVTMPYGSGQFTYWVDAGPATGCGPGLKTLEAVGQVTHLNRTFSTRVRACGVPGVPFLAALFGVSRLQFQGAASRTYLAPYLAGTPGGGGSVGSFTEINFADNDARINALSEESSETVTLRDGTFLDYSLFGFSERPSYNPNPTTNPTPWILSVFGDIIKARPATGVIQNRCGAQYACVTVANGMTDVERVSDLRETNYVHHVYMKRIHEEVLPQLALKPETFRAQAIQNTANAGINKRLRFRGVGSVYAPADFYRLVGYLATHPSQSLQGTVYVDGSVHVAESANLGSVTLAVRGDLIIDDKAAVTIRHDLSMVSGRQTPGIVVFGFHDPIPRPTEVCGTQLVNGSGRFVMCGGSTLVVDGLIYTQDGMAIESQASVDQVGAMYHDNRGTPDPSFTAQNATIVLRFDPLALSVFGNGMTILSWQQLR